MVKLKVYHAGTLQGQPGGTTTYPCADVAEAEQILTALSNATKVAIFRYDGGARAGALNIDHVLSVGMDTAEEVDIQEQLKQQQRDRRFGQGETS